MTSKRLLRLTGLLIVGFALAGCLAPTGPDTSGGDPGAQNQSGGISITGSATYSDDGDVPVSFTFEGDGSLDPSEFTGAPGSSVAVDGKLRAGDVVFDVTGTYAPDTGEFTISAIGEVGGELIEVTISGVYDLETDTIVSGEVVVTSTDTTTPGAEPLVFEGGSVEIGEAPGAPLSDTSGTTEAQAPSGGDKFWVGTWELNERYYYTVGSYEFEGEEYEYLQDAEGPTEYYEDMSLRVVGTPSQYRYSTTYTFSPAYTTFYELEGDSATFASTEVIVKMLAESQTSMKAVFKDLNATSGEEYSIQRLFIAPEGGLWGVYYIDPTADSDDDDYTAGSVSEAEATLTEEETIYYPDEEGVGLTRVD